MSEDIRPRTAFAEALGDWFVEEMSEQRPGRSVSAPPVRSDVEATLDDPAPGRRPRARWLLIANAALVVGAIVAAIVFVARPDPAPPSDTTSLPEPGVIARRVADACDRFAIDSVELPLGAQRNQVMLVAGSLTGRLSSAREDIRRFGFDLGVDVAEPVRLLDEAIASASVLESAGESGTREEIDQAVLNVDLLVLAWGRSMDGLAGSGSCSPPTLRETG